jgi:DNA polymerase-3 subunit delta'
MSGTSAAPWPPSLAGTPAVAVLERAISRKRLAHSLLLHGDELDTLVAVARAIADRLLNSGGPASRPGLPGPAGEGSGDGGHPDCFILRPEGKMRQISADATRDLIAKLQVTPAVAPFKVAILLEADRMNPIAANIFLKTLEEPPAHTVILMVTTRPYSLLPTIRSRCLHFKFAPSGADRATDGPPGGAAGDLSPDPLESGWAGWLRDYRAWLGRLGDTTAGKRSVSDPVLSLYGLIARFALVLERETAEAWEKQKGALPPNLEEEERVAIETGIANGRRARLFKDIEVATQDFARPLLVGGDNSARRVFATAIQKLEHDVGLLRVNLNASAALEDFLLASLRLWSRR